MSGPSSISRRIDSCIGCVRQRKYEDALIHYFPALDKTAKRRRPKAGVGDRIRGFLEDEEDLISAVGIGNIFKGCRVGGFTFPEAIYKFGRTSIAHEGELDSRLIISDSGSLKIGTAWELPSSYVLGLVVSVIVAPENKAEHIGKKVTFHFFDTSFEIDRLWGQEAMVRQLIDTRFKHAGT